MKFSLTIKKADIKKAKQHAIEEAVKNTTIKGFRKGKAPEDLVIKEVGQDKIIEHALEHLLPPAYAKAVTDKKITPITQPRFTPKSLKKDEDWEFEVEVAERPEVKLGDYQDALKTAFAKDKIWTPDKDKQAKEDEKSQEQLKNEKINKIFETLLQTAELDVPDMLVEEEVNHMLGNLLDQVQKLGMSIDDYLKTRGMDQKTLREAYKKQAQNSLKLEFILQEVTGDLGVKVEQKDVDQVTAGVTDEKALEQLKQPAEQARIKAVLLRRKTIDKLLTIA